MSGPSQQAGPIRKPAPATIIVLLLAAVLVLPATGSNRKPTQCNGTAKIGSDVASGCFHRDPRLGPKRLPKATDPVGTMTQVVPGMLVVRFGRATGGTFLAPAGTSFAMRSIPPSNLDTYPDNVLYNYHVYRVTALFTVQAGAIAPWFGQGGGGVQFKTCFADVPCSGPNEVDVSFLIAHRDLVEVSPGGRDRR